MKNKRKVFWRNFKFKYKLTITNENTLEEVVGIHVSKLNGVSVLLFAVTVIFKIVTINAVSVGVLTVLSLPIWLRKKSYFIKYLLTFR